MDPRLTFTNMATKTRLDEALDQIWKPTVVFVGAKYENNVNLHQGVNIIRVLFAESSTKGIPAVVNSSRGENKCQGRWEWVSGRERNMQCWRL